jgi:hypothetical protein
MKYTIPARPRQCSLFWGEFHGIHNRLEFETPDMQGQVTIFITPVEVSPVIPPFV